MPTHYVKLIESPDPHDFQNELQKYLFTFSGDPFIDPGSIHVEFAMIPATHYAALVTWTSYEFDEMDKHEREQQPQLPLDPAEA